MQGPASGKKTRYKWGQRFSARECIHLGAKLLKSVSLRSQGVPRVLTCQAWDLEYHIALSLQLSVDELNAVFMVGKIGKHLIVPTCSRVHI
mmetsp:Transcript_14258/g.30932  ORF Transcript_14258/g.30932 Transcript_14258/m.30932 type:complete len:91 (+) Transcript_14258:218-490(+)